MFTHIIIKGLLRGFKMDLLKVCKNMFLPVDTIERIAYKECINTHIERVFSMSKEVQKIMAKNLKALASSKKPSDDRTANNYKASILKAAMIGKLNGLL